jgi:hypothetical protein
MKSKLASVGLVGVFALGISAVACSASAANDEAPVAEVDALSAQDEGTDYNGWSQWAEFRMDLCSPGYNDFYIVHGLSRWDGDATRGGGGCAVYTPGTSCSVDSDCQAQATGTFGAAAYGYCYQGSCALRPGSQSDYCAMSPNRAAGELWKYKARADAQWISGVLGCMTKTAGPNAACGGTNNGLYMRAVFSGVTYWQSWNCE